jgi:hypothetical protein
MTPSIHDTVWTLPEPELTQIHELSKRLLDLRRNFCNPPGQSSLPRKDPEASDYPEPSALPPRLDPKASYMARRPLRQPKPGSLRGDVHSVLDQAAKPMSRAEVSSRVAKMRGTLCDDSLTNKVGEILRSPHDTRIKKLRHGIYRYDH